MARQTMIKQTENGVLIEVRAKPNSRSFGLFRRDGRLILEVTSPPQEGKANLEIVRGLKRLLGRDVEIVRGLKGKDKLILVKDSTVEYVLSRFRDAL